MQRSQDEDSSSPSAADSPSPIEGLSPQRGLSAAAAAAAVVETELGEGDLQPQRQLLQPHNAADTHADLNDPAAAAGRMAFSLGGGTPAPAKNAAQSLARIDGRDAAPPDFSLAGLPPPQPWELDFVLRNFESLYLRPGTRGGGGVSAGAAAAEEAVHSQWRETPALTFRLLLHPATPGDSGGSGASRRSVGCFVELTRKADYPEDWAFLQSCRFYIYAINPRDYRQSTYRADCFAFSHDCNDRGWHQFLSYEDILHENFLHKGDLYFRAGCTPLCAAVSRRLRHSPPALTNPNLSPPEAPSQRALAVLGRAGRGYVGLKNHGATCYMNALLQSLYFIGKFRQAVYALNFDSRSAKSSCSREILERRRKRRHALRRSEKTSSARTELLLTERNGSVEEGLLMDVEEPQPQPLARDASVSPSFSSSDTSGSDLSDVDDEALRALLAEEEAERSSIPSISLALQNVFLRLYTSYEAVPCKELIQSFGWGTAEALTQQDTHELLKLLLDKVEEQTAAAAAGKTPLATSVLPAGAPRAEELSKSGKSGGSAVSRQRSDGGEAAEGGAAAEAEGGGCVKSMFEGEMETYVQCLNVDYSSRRREAFQDINLDVRGCSGVRESLQKLIAPEMLEGDNLYDAEEHGRQRAKKGVRFLRFPPVCVFLLKRFDFDFEKMETVKVFDRFEFERELDLSEFCEGAGVYVLHSVSVHQGDVNSGHYYCFIRPPPGDQWVRFDDDKVYPVSEYAAIGDNFGGEEVDCCNYLRGERKPRSRTKPYNAYILVYVAKNESSKLLADNSPMVGSEATGDRDQLLLARVKVYHPLQFKYRRFLELPIASVTPLFEFKRTRDTRIYPVHEAITTELRRLLYGGQSGGAAAPRVPVHFTLHLLNTHMASPRFERLELGENLTLGLIQKKLFADSRLDARLDACMHILAVPVNPTVFYDAQQHDAHLRSSSLFFIKYFQNADTLGVAAPSPVGGHSAGTDPCNHSDPSQQPLQPFKLGEEEKVICLDVVAVPPEMRPVDLEGHVCRLLLQAIQDGKISEPAARVEELKAWAAQLPSDLPPLSSCAPFAAPLQPPLIPAGKTEASAGAALANPVGVVAAVNASAMLRPPASFSFSCCLELDAQDKMESAKLKPRKSLSQMHVRDATWRRVRGLPSTATRGESLLRVGESLQVYSGDLLVFSVDLPESVRQLRESQSIIGRRPEDFVPQEVYAALSSETEGHAALERIHKLWKPGAPPGAARGSPGMSAQTLERTSATFSSVQEQLASARAATGGLLPPLLPFVSRKRGGDIPPAPPPLPAFLCEDFVEYLAHLQAREVYQIRLYDPVETLNAVTAACGRLLPSPSFCPLPTDSPPLPSEPSGTSLTSLTSLPGAEATAGAAGDGALGGLAAKTLLSTAGTDSAPSPGRGGGSAEASLLSLVEERGGESSVEKETLPAPAAPPATAGVAAEEEDSQQPLPEDPWLHIPRGRPIVVREFVLDSRTPCKRALLWIAWQLGVDPCRLAVFPEPPLLSDKQMELTDVDAFVASGGSGAAAGVTPHSTSSGELSSSQSSASAGGAEHPVTLAEMCTQGRHSQQQGFRLGPGGFGALDRRRMLMGGSASLLSANAAGGAGCLGGGLANRIPLELHLALLPRPSRLCQRTIDGSSLSQSLLLQLQRELLHPLPPAALGCGGGLSSASSGGGNGASVVSGRASSLVLGSALGSASPPLLHTVLPYYVQVFSRQAESLCCVAALIPAFGLDGSPMTARHLILDVVKRLPASAAAVLRQDFAAVNAALRVECLEGGVCATPPSSPQSLQNADSPATEAALTASRRAGETEREEDEDAAVAALLGPLRLVLADSSHFRAVAPNEPLLALPHYAPPRNERMEAVNNLIATPLRIEPALTKDELLLVERGARKVLLVVHQTPGEREPFGHPFEILVEPTSTISAIRSQIRKKCLLPKAAWSAPIFFQAAEGTRSWKGANDTLDWEKYSDITLISKLGQASSLCKGGLNTRPRTRKIAHLVACELRRHRSWRR